MKNTTFAVLLALMIAAIYGITRLNDQHKKSLQALQPTPIVTATEHFHTLGQWEKPERNWVLGRQLQFVQFRYCPVCGAADSRIVHTAEEKP